MSSKVLVVGKGKPFYVSQGQASQWVHDAQAIWQKAGRRISYTADKCSRVEVRGLSCFVGEAIATDLNSSDKKARDVALSFLKNQLLKREIVVPTA